jgi:hypothetical protein
MIASIARDLALLFGVFAAVTALAALLGAANLGTAMTFGQIAFMAAVVGLILWRSRDRLRAGGTGSAAPPARGPRSRGPGRGRAS